MAKPDGVIEKRLANARIDEAEAGAMAKKLLGSAGQAGLAAATKLVGGMWVGGTAYLTAETIEFHPNTLNRLAHSGGTPLDVVIQLKDVDSVTKRFGLATQIIEIEAAGAALCVRCYGAQSFVEAIEKARANLA